MTNWTTVSSLATAGGTLVLALATFASVRSANRSARATERALLAGIRPVLAPSRVEDPAEDVSFVDDHRVQLKGGHAHVDATDEAIYLAMALRNVGTGIAVLDRWEIYDERARGELERGATASFRRLTRDIYIAAGDVGFWQGAMRDTSDPLFEPIRAAIDGHQAMTVDLLYGDHEGGQRTVSRFALLPEGDDGWVVSVSRHWNLDRSDPR
ncbi:MAG: hypothetical protein JWN46_998 [Acidimicrobiales bacterium]|nr:hypothetical protein [Acidimicrobiales bacterium]